MEYLTLNNGTRMPMAGIGVFMMSPAEAEAAVESALRSGVRLIDTANGYMNESGTGRGIKKSGVAREEIFLVTKLWPTVYEKETAIDETLKRLDTDYIDLLFLHQPTDNWREGYKNIEKAYVYLPYGYDENDTETQYNILYLMHGWGGHAGEYFEYGSQKNLFDNLIEKGDIPPLIIVSASFYHDGSDRGFSSSITAFRAFHNEFENDLMPAVEETYHTYAVSVSDEDLKASRDHRAFGGFSLGSVTTWLSLCYDYDYIHYFLPMSGSSWYYGTYGDFQIENNVDFIEQLVTENDLADRGYFIYHAVGTNDAVKSQSVDMADEMLSREIFTPDHYVFFQKDRGYHDFNAVQEYLYNALPLFF